MFVLFGFETFVGKCRGLVNDIRVLNINKVAIGNLNINDIFVDEHWIVKISPINLSREFHTPKKGNRTKMNLIEKGKKGIATGFFSLDDPKGK